VNIQDFSTTFTFKLTPSSNPTTPLGDGLTFIIQNDTGHRAGPDHGEVVSPAQPDPR